MPGCEVWDLVKVPFPYANRPVQQRRPALVVSVPNAPGALRLLWVLMVTSAANRGWPGDVFVSDLHAAGLPAASVVRCAKIATIEARDAERIGRLSLEDRTPVVDTLASPRGRPAEANDPTKPAFREATCWWVTFRRPVV